MESCLERVDQTSAIHRKRMNNLDLDRELHHPSTTVTKTTNTLPWNYITFLVCNIPAVRHFRPALHFPCSSTMNAYALSCAYMSVNCCIAKVQVLGDGVMFKIDFGD